MGCRRFLESSAYVNSDAGGTIQSIRIFRTSFFRCASSACEIRRRLFSTASLGDNENDRHAHRVNRRRGSKFSLNSYRGTRKKDVEALCVELQALLSKLRQASTQSSRNALPLSMCRVVIHATELTIRVAAISAIQATDSV